ncbi:MAG: DivIVA domain-containing protein [Oscillospiraceae bacterium]|nr:DivIVA domain-containing protein [Oscillospiraceae bacterium]MBQ5337884.1 DivIVA domain-containing protein [Oscillospiraceae bacterium]
MITAKDIQKKKFEKVKFGYSPEEVDAFLSQIENDLRLMQQDLDDSNDKIQLLADKVREYKDSEEDLKNALLLAQKQARQVVAEAEEKANAIVTEARNSVDSVKSQALIDSETQLKNISAQLAQENASLVRTQHQVADFKRALFDMYKQHLALISSLPDSPEDLEEETEEVVEIVEVEEEETPAEAAAPAAEQAATPAEQTASAAADAFDGVAQSTFGSRRDETRRDDVRKRFDF